MITIVPLSAVDLSSYSFTNANVTLFPVASIVLNVAVVLVALFTVVDLIGYVVVEPLLVSVTVYSPAGIPLSE